MTPTSGSDYLNGQSRKTERLGLYVRINAVPRRCLYGCEGVAATKV